MSDDLHAIDDRATDLLSHHDHHQLMTMKQQHHHHLLPHLTRSLGLFSLGRDQASPASISHGWKRSDQLHLINNDFFPAEGLKQEKQKDTAGTEGGTVCTSDFPQMDKNMSRMQKRPSSQLTIFYGGTVNVYNDVPADKAQAIMLLAGDGKPTQNNIRDSNSLQNSMAMPSPPVVKDAVLPFTFLGESKQPLAKRPHTELPFARKLSLARFLEKRKDRIQGKPPLSAEDECKDWEPPKEESKHTEGTLSRLGDSQASKRLCCPGRAPALPSGQRATVDFIGDLNSPTFIPTMLLK